MKRETKCWIFTNGEVDWIRSYVQDGVQCRDFILVALNLRDILSE